MTNKTFSKLGRIRPYSDFIIVGIETSRGKTDERIDAIFESIERFSVAHMRTRDRKLIPVEPITEFEGCNVLSTILEHYQLGRNALLICNKSLVLLGSSDLTALLEVKVYAVATGTEDAADLGIDDSRGISTSIFVASAPPTIVGLRSLLTENRITIIDIANYGIKRLAEYKEYIHTSDNGSNDRDEDKDKDFTKCEISCKGMTTIFSKYHDLVFKHGLGGIALTYAGQAMRAYRGKHYDGTIQKHSNEIASTIEERAYIGGRCEARYRGWFRGKCHLLDFNSLYPAIGRVSVFPRELANTYANPAIASVRNSIESSCWFAHCRVRTREPLYPCKIEGELKWPIGEFNTYLCGPELREAILRDDIVCIYYASEYHQGLICKSYSDDMIALRQRYKKTKDKISEHIIKCITNGLWGKFGEQGNRWIICDKGISTSRYGGFVHLAERTGVKTYYRIIDGVCSKLARSYWQNNTYCPVSACINAYCRNTMWRYMQLVGLPDVLYLCIDGFIITDRGYDKLASASLIDQSRPGSMKVVESASECYILGPGQYRIGKKIAYSGVAIDNDYIYKGFWNIRDERYAINAMTLRMQSMAVERHRPQDLRDRLGIFDHEPGSFIAPVEYEDQKIESVPIYSREYQQELSFDHYRQ